MSPDGKAGILFEMAKSSSRAREGMTLDTLLYHLHKARENWAFVSQTSVGLAYKGTLVWQIAQGLPEKYENAIRNRNAELCFQARQDTFRKAGLL
jgi:hypothetical protein